MNPLKPVPPAPVSPTVPPSWPGARSDHVWRTPLCERIAAPDAARLVLVRAPAGFGKTTAMQQARAQLEAEGSETAWLTLERADNDVPRLLARLGQALAWLAPDGGAGLAPLDALALLAGHAAPLVLFLDDFEQLQEAAALGLIKQVLDKLPRRGRLVLGSRVQPELGLARLRVLGQLSEIETEALRFDTANTAEFLRLRGLPALKPASLAVLQAKTEGWVAALWLASLALERHPDPEAFVARFSGSERAVADYLAEDVLARQSPELRDFLLHTAILRQLDLPLCQALLPRADCARILTQLEIDSTFLSVLPTAPGEPPAWRYHSLFADFLQAQLARQHPEDLARLHLAAAGWYEGQGRPVPAIDHALEGGDAPYALGLLAKHAEPLLVAGRMQLLVRWFAALPGGALKEQPLLQVVAVWASCFTQGPWEAMRQLERIALAEITEAAVHAHAGALRPLLLSMMDRYDEAYEAGRASLARLPSCRPFADRALINTMASVAAVMGEEPEAERLLEAARDTSEGSRFERGFTEAMQALLDLQQGRLRQACARYRLVLMPAARRGGSAAAGAHSGNAWAGVLYAGAIYELNQLDEARELLDLYLPPARQIGLPDHMIIGQLMHSRIAFAHGEIDTAYEGLTELEYLGHQRRLPRVAAAAKVERARLLMLQGHGQAAREELDRAEDAALWSRVERLCLPAHQCEDLLIGRLRWEIALGDAQAALPRLAGEIARSERAGRQLRIHKLRLLHALALQRSGDAAGAQRGLLALLADTCPEGYMRLILDEGEPAAQLLHRCRVSEQAPPLLDDYLQRLREAAGPAPAEAEDAAAQVPLPPLAEPLTRKEIRILELLAEGYSNNAMAEKLFVSDSTVRTHLRNINLKLGARSRTQAVALARRLGALG